MLYFFSSETLLVAANKPVDVKNVQFQKLFKQNSATNLSFNTNTIERFYLAFLVHIPHCKSRENNI